MIRAARVLAVILPVAGLAGLWAMSANTYRQGTEWEVPIQGYDPRDMLRGHYVEFSYDWPGMAEDFGIGPQRLCLEGDAPRITRATELAEGAACAHPLIADTDAVYGIGGLARGRLYVGQDRAAQLDRTLRNRDQRGIVTVRQREDGSFTPVSIRFRPLTAQERAERNAPRVEPAVPPIMTGE
jgi:hypothetical protein